jgi:NADH-quinone oxidoreductase subunit N
LGAAISAYYYFRVIQSMFFKSADENPAIAVSGGFRLMLLVTAALVILLGIKPGLLLGLLNY